MLACRANLYSYRARWYDPQAGRFLREDPLSFTAGDTNLYRYVFNSPTNAVDPTGQDWVWPWDKTAQWSWDPRDWAIGEAVADAWNGIKDTVVATATGVLRAPRPVITTGHTALAVCLATASFGGGMKDCRRHWNNLKTAIKEVVKHFSKEPITARGTDHVKEMSELLNTLRDAWGKWKRHCIDRDKRKLFENPDAVPAWEQLAEQLVQAYPEGKEPTSWDPANNPWRLPGEEPVLKYSWCEEIRWDVVAQYTATTVVIAGVTLLVIAIALEAPYVVIIAPALAP